MDASIAQLAGMQTSKPTKYQPLGTKRFFTGLVTSRSPLIEPGTRSEARFYGGRPDALWDGLNVEISADNTLIRRPGFSLLKTLPQAALGYYSFKPPLSPIKVLADTAGAVYVVPSSGSPTALFAKNTAAKTFFQGVGSQLFMTDGVDLLKWDGTTLSNWGIVPPVNNPTLTIASGGSYTITSNLGVSYVFCFYNSTTGHVSTASPISAYTGPQSGVSITVSGSGSTDSQVDKIQIYRTTDGGATYYLLATIANPGAGTWSYVDSGTPDYQLNNLLIAPQALSNNPPPAGLQGITYFSGRMWGFVGSYLYYSNGSATTNGSGNESWPPLNYALLPSAITRLVPFPNGLLIFTVDDLYYLSAPGATPAVFQAGLGVLSYNAVDVNGSSVYAFTTDCNVVQITPGAGILDLGHNVAKAFEIMNPANVSLAYHIFGHRDNALFLCNGSGNFFRCCPNQMPEGGEVWSPMGTIAAGASNFAAIETSYGVHQLIVSSGTNILYRDWSSHTDTGSTYEAYAVIGSIVLAMPGQLCEVESVTVEALRVGTSPGVGVLLNEISGTFESLPISVADPPKLIESTTLYRRRFYLRQTQDPIVCHHLQLKIDFNQDSVANELFSYSLYGCLRVDQ